MPPEESRYPRDWLRIADKDWKRVDHALDASDAEGAGFWLQQALEKYLKAYLLSKGWTLRKVHQPDLSRYVKAYRKISGYYVAERYPLMEAPSLTLQDVVRSRDEITGLIESVRREAEP